MRGYGEIKVEGEGGRYDIVWGGTCRMLCPMYLLGRYCDVATACFDCETTEKEKRKK